MNTCRWYYVLHILLHIVIPWRILLSSDLRNTGFVSPVVVIHWTRQIKEVLTSQETMESSDSSGPLEEIEFWRARCEDLSGLTTQLDQPGVLKVVKIIQKAKSSYLAPFQRLSRQIQVSILCLSLCTQ